MKPKPLLVLAAAWLVSGSLYAQEAPPLGNVPLPTGRTRDTTTDSPQRVDFSVDSSMTQRPLDPRDEPAARRDSRRAAGVDRPVDKPVEAGVHNAYVSRARDAPVQGKPRRRPD